MTIIVVGRLKHSRIGLALQALREDEIACEAMGIDLTKVKLSAFALGSCWAGFAGVIFAAKTTFINPASFTFMESAMILSMVVLGGMGSMTGSVLAAIAMYLLNYEIKNGAWVSALPGFVQTLFQFPMLIYALVLLVIIIFRPRGILGTYEFSLDRLLFDGRLAEKRKAKARKGGADA